MSGAWTRVSARVAAKPLWHHIDGRGQIVGRLASQVARLLVGKHKPTYLPHVDSGDYVVVTNARHVALSGRKYTDKTYKWHTGYPGGLKSVTVAQLMEKHPERVLTRAVRGMVPRNSLHKIRMRRLRVFADDAHTHETDVEASKALAPDFVEFMEPRRYELREQEAGGDLVRELEEVPAEDLEAGEMTWHPDFNPDDPNFDLEAFLQQLEEEEAAGVWRYGPEPTDE